MRADKLHFIGVAPLLAVLAFSPDADAYCRTTTISPQPDAPFTCTNAGAPLYHPSACVTYRIVDKSGASPDAPSLEEKLDLSDTIARAFATWTSTNDQCNGISLLELEPIKTAKIAEYVKGATNHNVIGFVDGPWPHGGGETLSLATLTFDATTGAVFDADIEISSQVAWSVSNDTKIPENGFDLHTAMLHEAGHFLGLSHTDKNDAVMFASYTPGTVNRALSPDDKAAVCAAYPSKQTRQTGAGPIAATACNLAPAAAPGTAACGDPDIKHGCAAAPSGPSGAGSTFVIVAAAAAALVVGRRRRQA